MLKVKIKGTKGTSRIFTVYGTRVEKNGETKFFIFDECWFWSNAENFIPVKETNQ